MKNILNSSTLYFWIRHLVTGGVPYKKWLKISNLDNEETRVLDLGCGPIDILRFIEDKKPQFYHGIDISTRYLKTAEKILNQNNIEHKLEIVDLTKIGKDKAVDEQLKTSINNNNINTVVLIGVLHHISTDSILRTFSLLRECKTIKKIFTHDVVKKQNLVNDFFVKLDRGEFIREEEEYVDILEQSKWKIKEKIWTHAGISKIKYIHFELN